MESKMASEKIIRSQTVPVFIPVEDWHQVLREYLESCDMGKPFPLF
jgi:hypothetical protein